MADPDYSRLIAERVHEGLNFNRNHRLFLIYGRLTEDEFVTRSMYRSTLRETLWATLKASRFDRVIFYSAAEKFFFLDEESARLGERLAGPRPAATRTDSAPAGRARMRPGPLGSRNVLRRPARMVTSAAHGGENSQAGGERPAAAAATANAGESAGGAPGGTDDGAQPPPAVIRMAGTRGAAMSDAAVLTHFNDFMLDGAVRTAIVVEDLENLSRRFDDRIKDQLATRLGEWNSLKAENRNVLIFITSREPGDERSVDTMKSLSSDFPEVANLINVALGDRRAEAEGFVWYVPPPYDAEIARLLDDVRLRYGLPVDWPQRERLVRLLAAENKPLRHLDGLFTEYAHQRRGDGERLAPETARRRKWVHGDADPRSASERLEQMIGMGQVKEKVRRLLNWLRAEKTRQEQNPGRISHPPNLHLVLTGNPGTGKSTVARLIGEIYRDIGLLRRGHTVECSSAQDLVGQYVGETTQKTNARINEALDGVLFIDEAYALQREGTAAYGQEAVDTLVARMENERHRLAVIVAGYPEEMRRFINSNPGLPGRFPNEIELPDYSPDELLQIFEQMIGQRGLTVGAETRETMRALLARMHELRDDRNYFPVDEQGRSGYRNAGTVRNLVEAMAIEQAHRLDSGVSDELTAEDIPEKEHKFLPGVRQSKEADAELKRLMEELNRLVGLRQVKDIVRKLVIEQQIAIRFKRDPAATGKTRHMLFTGNPGTGKTTVARLIGEIYKALGILKRGHFVEGDRSSLVAGYIGQTEEKTNKVIEDALDGVLFIDEAYSLSSGSQGDFGQIAIDMLVRAMENHRNRLVVIFAGYTREMEAFLNANSGIRSRFGHTVDFPDYAPDELLEIFEGMAAEGGYAVSEDVRAALRRQFAHLSANAGPHFGNARDVRVKFYQRMVEETDTRLYEAIAEGRDPAEVASAFVISDVPDLAPRERRDSPRRFRAADIAAAQRSGAPSYSAQDVPEQVGRAVGFIKTEKGSGTGFVISPEGHVLTAYHVVEGARSIKFRPSNSPYLVEAEYLDGDEVADLAVLKLEGGGATFVRLVAPGYKLSRGVSLGLIGYPLGEAFGAEFTYTSGPLSSVRTSPEGINIFQIDVSAYRGNSGGPVFLSETGEVIGVLSYGPNDTMNFATSVEELYQRFK